MVEKIHHEDAIGNILYNTKITNHWTKSLHAALLLYFCTLFSILLPNRVFSPKEWSKMNIDMDREDNCLEDYEMYKNNSTSSYIVFSDAVRVGCDPHRI